MAEIKNIQNSENENKTNENKDGLIRIKLGRPVTYNGKEYTELNFNYEKLTGADCENLYAELRAHGVAVMVESMTPEYLTGMAAKACEQPIGRDIFGKMALKDYIAIKKTARDFLLAAE